MKRARCTSWHFPTTFGSETTMNIGLPTMRTAPRAALLQQSATPSRIQCTYQGVLYQWPRTGRAFSVGLSRYALDGPVQSRLTSRLRTQSSRTIHP